MLSKTLVAVDGSPESEKAFEVAAGRLHPENDELHVLYVISPKKYETLLSEEGYNGTLPLEDLREKFLEHEKAMLFQSLEEIAERHGYTFTAHVAIGDPRSEIVSFAEQIEATALVLGSTGKGLGSRLLLGSVSNYVVTHSPITTIVVR